MAILGYKTINNVWILEVTAAPDSGVSAPKGSLAMDKTNGKLYIAQSVGPMVWAEIGASGSSGTVNAGTAGRLGIYPASASTIGDVYDQNSQHMYVAIAAQASRSTTITYTIPNPGDAVSAASFVLTEGAQTINGEKTFGSNAVFSGNLTVNGTLTYINTTNLEVTDKLITINKGGAAASAGGAGIEFEEDSAIAGYLKVSSDRNSLEFKAPNKTNKIIFTNTADTGDITINQSSHDAVTLGGSNNSSLSLSGSDQVLTLSSTPSFTSLSLSAATNQLAIGATGHIATINVAAPTGATVTYNVPDVGASDFVMTAGSQTVGGAKTFSSAVTISPVSNQLVLGGAGSTNTVPISAGTPASSRVYTMPDAGGAANFIMSAGNPVINSTLEIVPVATVSQKIDGGTVATTDATETLIKDITIPSNNGIMATIKIIGISSSGNAVASFIRNASAKYFMSNVSMVNPVDAIYTAKESGMETCNVLIDINNTNKTLEVKVVGPAALPVRWNCIVEYSTVVYS